MFFYSGEMTILFDTSELTTSEFRDGENEVFYGAWNSVPFGYVGRKGVNVFVDVGRDPGLSSADIYFAKKNTLNAMNERRFLVWDITKHEYDAEFFRISQLKPYDMFPDYMWRMWPELRMYGKARV